MWGAAVRSSIIFPGLVIAKNDTRDDEADFLDLKLFISPPVSGGESHENPTYRFAFVRGQGEQFKVDRNVSNMKNAAGDDEADFLNLNIHISLPVSGGDGQKNPTYQSNIMWSVGVITEGE